MNKIFNNDIPIYGVVICVGLFTGLLITFILLLLPGLFYSYENIENPYNVDYLSVFVFYCALFVFLVFAMLLTLCPIFERTKYWLPRECD